MPTQPYELISARALQVLGEYDHRLAFESASDFVIIYGPNGVGKTKFLEIIHALSRVNAPALSSIPFSAATLNYSDGHSLTALADTSIEYRDFDQEITTQRVSPRKIRFVLQFEGIDKYDWLYTGDTFEARPCV